MIIELLDSNNTLTSRHVLLATPSTLLLLGKTVIFCISCYHQAHFMMNSHSTVLFSLNWAKPSCPAIVQTCRKIKEIDLRKFQSHRQSSALLQCPADNLDDLALQYQSTLSTVLAVHAPLVSTKFFQRVCHPWFVEAKNLSSRPTDQTIVQK